VPTISFVSSKQSSAEIARGLQQRGFALRCGHNYAHRLVEALVAVNHAQSAQDGVVRISMLHYNTPEELDKLCAALDEVLK
jgi:selenocysteine lyase/cysteine desulfurase